MRAINHAMSGAIIGLSAGNPVVAAGLAVVSHFVLDAVPHHGDGDRYDLGSKPFSQLLIVDALLCVALVMVLLAVLPLWTAVTASLCAFLATSPDLMWVNRYLAARNNRADPGIKGLLQQLHAKVQWSETPAGKYIEIAAALVFLVTLSKLI